MLSIKNSSMQIVGFSNNLGILLNVFIFQMLLLTSLGKIDCIIPGDRYLFRQIFNTSGHPVEILNTYVSTKTRQFCIPNSLLPYQFHQPDIGADQIILIGGSSQYILPVGRRLSFVSRRNSSAAAQLNNFIGWRLFSN